MKRSYAQAITEARKRYKEHMEESAADAVFIASEHDRPLQTVCKGIAGDDWNALRVRAQRLGKAAGQTAEERARRMQMERARRQRSEAKSALLNPEQVAKVISSLPSAALDDVYHEARLARAGETRTPAARKAAHAAASTAIAPMKRALDRTQQGLVLQALEEARDDLRRLLDDGGALTSEGIKRGQELANEIANLLMEAEFRMAEV